MMNLKVAVPKCRAERDGLVIPESKLPKRAHISPRYLAAIELGEKIPKADVMVRIIRAMGGICRCYLLWAATGSGKWEQASGTDNPAVIHQRSGCSLLLLWIPYLMYVSGSADWAKQKNSKEKGIASFWWAMPLSTDWSAYPMAQAHHQYFLISGSFYLARDSSLLFYACDFISASYKSTTA